MGVSQSAVSKLESTSSNPSVATLDRALRATGHRLRATAEPWSADIDVAQLRDALELTAGERIVRSEELYRWAREFALAGERARGELA